MKSAEQGFILPAVLWIVSGLALIAAVTTQWVSSGVEGARQRQSEIESERQIHEAQQRLIFFLTTHFFSPRGVEMSNADVMNAGPLGTLTTQGGLYVGLDDRPYILDGVTMRLQDCRGLVNLNLAQEDEVFRLLGVEGVPLQARGPLIAKLKDYTSPGDLIRLNGAKRNEYLAAGRRPPTYLPLVTPYEARYVLDWDKYPSLWRESGGLPSVTTTASTAIGINLNTAPPLILGLVEGMNPRAVELIVQGRMNRPIISMQDAQALGQVTILDDPLRYIFFPSDSIRLRLKTPGRSLERVTVIRLTPQSPEGHPWRIDYSIDVPPLFPDDPNQPTQPFPDTSTTPVPLAQ